MRNEDDALFDLDAVFEVDDYMFVYEDDLTDERSDREVASLVEVLELDAPMRILDMACGFGRHSCRLAARGHTVVGIDHVSGFLDLARQRATEMEVQVDFRQGDMREASFEEEFDLGLLLFTSLGYFEDDVNERVLRNMARALRPGGRLAFDALNRDVFLRDMFPASVREKGDGLVIDRLSFDVLTGRFSNRRILIRNGTRRDMTATVRLYSATEVRRILEKAGLVDTRFYGKGNKLLTSEQQSVDSHRMLVVARKPVKA